MVRPAGQADPSLCSMTRHETHWQAWVIHGSSDPARSYGEAWTVQMLLNHLAKHGQEVYWQSGQSMGCVIPLDH